MAMDGMPPQIAMETACRSVAFYTQKMELQMQCKMNRLTAQCRQKWEAMQEPFTSKLEQMNTAYQEKSERCQMIEQESLSKDNQELQEKISEISRQMRKLEETYNQLRNDFELMKVFAIEPANNFFFPRGEPDWFAGPANMGDNRDTVRKDWPVSTRGPREDIWPTTRPNSCNFGPFVSSPVKILGQHMRPVGRSRLGGQASMPLRYLILSPLKRPQPSQNKA